MQDFNTILLLMIMTLLFSSWEVHWNLTLMFNLLVFLLLPVTLTQALQKKGALQVAGELCHPVSFYTLCLITHFL